VVVATVTQVAHLVIKEAITVRTAVTLAATKAEQVAAAVVIEAAQLEIFPTKTDVVAVGAVVAVASALILSTALLAVILVIQAESTTAAHTVVPTASKVSA
jgi:hypothetical protein